MSLENPEFEPGRDEEAEGNPQDGRDTQPVQEGSSDDPRTLESMDPLRDEQREVDELSGHEAGAAGTPPESEAEQMAAQTDLEGTAGDLVDEPTDVAGQEPGGLDALGRPLPTDEPEANES